MTPEQIIARIIGKAVGEKFVLPQESKGQKVIAALAKNGYCIVSLARSEGAGK